MTSSGELQRQIVAAVWGGDPIIVECLLERDPKLVHVRDPFGRTLIEISANQVFDRQPQYGHIAAKLVAAGAACNIFTAARAGLLNVIKQLLATSPGLAHAIDASGRTALQRAALINGRCAACDAVVDELCGHGSPIDIFTACTLGWPSVVAGEIAITPMLVDTYRQGGTPLLWGVRPRRNESSATMIAATLLNAGAALNVRDTEGDENTPLHHAARWADQADLVRVLVRAGADVDLLNANGKSALDLAIAHGHAASAALLEVASRRRVPA